MTSFGKMLRNLRTTQGLSLAHLALQVHYSKGYLSNVERGKKPPTEDLARSCDQALNARGELIAAAHLDVVASTDTTPWQTAELIRRIQASDTTPGTLEGLHATVADLCCQYPYQDASDLRAEALRWLDQVCRLLRRPVGLHDHTELLVAAGWLALLIGCLEYDLGMRTAAEATRTAARQLGDEAGHSEIIAWTYEMSAWFALTQGRYADVVGAAQAGQAVDRAHGVHVQLIAQEAKARARIRDNLNLARDLERGHQVLNRLPTPGRVDNHFVVDPSKWNYYAMDAFRLAGDDEHAEEHARIVIAANTTPDGIVRAPMRIAESKLTLATIASRRGDLEEAFQLGMEALQGPRKSLPSLVMVAGELDSELHRRFPSEGQTADFHEALSALR
ncbi:helix-turn-helix domain-containing protein [Actinopolymorpha sp. NPDC004070]|uniref:helix-turn-helix domain-containing protein n=1 Tax=Actinopolymorpha sp. NPDC004070 TaxID=3154548 RepID=UPI0033A0975A